jgi:hypothetical protein
MTHICVTGLQCVNKKFNDGTLMKQNIVVGHFVSLVYGHVMQATDAIPHSKVWTIVGTTYQTIFNCLMLLMTFGMTLVL